MFADRHVKVRGTWDWDAWAGYLNLRQHVRARTGSEVAKTVEADAVVNYDFDADGNLLGVEILPAHPEPGIIRDARYRGLAGESG